MKLKRSFSNVRFEIVEGIVTALENLHLNVVLKLACAGAISLLAAVVPSTGESGGKAVSGVVFVTKTITKQKHRPGDVLFTRCVSRDQLSHSEITDRCFTSA